MILYVNGAEFTCGSRLNNQFRCASDDIKYVTHGSRSHPDNLKGCWGFHLSRLLQCALVNDARPDNTLDDIVRQTVTWARTYQEQTVIIELPPFYIGAIKTNFHDSVLTLVEELESAKADYLFFTMHPCSILSSNHLGINPDHFINIDIDSTSDEKNRHYHTAMILMKPITRMIRKQ